jgi:hypothetical protein
MVPATKKAEGMKHNHDIGGHPKHIAVDGSIVLPHDHRECDNVKFVCPGDGPIWAYDSSDLVDSSL